MKYLLATIFLIPSLAFAGTCWDGGSSGAAPWDVLDGSGGSPSCAYADVNYCNNTVGGGGEVINVPSGDCTWGTTLTISVSNHIIGAGTTSTIIRNGTGGQLIYFNPTDYTANNSFRLSGIYFDFNSSGSDTFRIGPSKVAPFTVQDDFRIDHNVFDEMTGTSSFWNRGVAYGVIDNNRFEYLSGNYPFKNDPEIVTGYDWWVDSPQKDYTLGSNKNMYYEDNIINMYYTAETALAECQYGGRYAFRYNTVTTLGPSYNFFEMHGHQTSGDMPSCFGAEVYGNDIDADNDDIILFKVRGGSSVIFGNSASDVSGQWSVIAYTSLTTCSAEDPNGESVHDTYQWANRLNDTGTLATTTGGGGFDGCGDYDNRPLEGRDIVGPDSTPTMAYGANLPATCATFEGYWVTTQDYTDLTNFVGVDPTTPLDGTLYDCTATDTWTELFTPYTYPHPLRGESASVSHTLGTFSGSGSFQ